MSVIDTKLALVFVTRLGYLFVVIELRVTHKSGPSLYKSLTTPLPHHSQYIFSTIRFLPVRSYIIDSRTIPLFLPLHKYT